jgi:hypothetical protein
MVMVTFESIYRITGNLTTTKLCRNNWVAITINFNRIIGFSTSFSHLR